MRVLVIGVLAEEILVLFSLETRGMFEQFDGSFIR